MSPDGGTVFFTSNVMEMRYELAQEACPKDAKGRWW